MKTTIKIKCPYCDMELDYPISNDMFLLDNSSDIMCVFCGYTFKLVKFINVEYKAIPYVQ